MLSQRLLIGSDPKVISELVSFHFLHSQIVLLMSGTCPEAAPLEDAAEPFWMVLCRVLGPGACGLRSRVFRNLAL